MKELNVIGTMQLLAACQKAPGLRHLVVKSTSTVYGASSRDPAMFTEEMAPRASSQGGLSKDAVEVEGYVRGFARRRADVGVSVLRMANIIGPTIDNAFTRYLNMPVVPTALGFDPRLQLLHESDAVETLRLATVAHRPGVVNVAGAGVVALSQVLRHAGRLRLPVPAPALGVVGGLVRNSGVIDFTAEESQYLNFGRVVDTTRLREQFGFTPRYTTAEAVESYLSGVPPRRRLVLAGLGVGSEMLHWRLDRRALAASRG